MQAALSVLIERARTQRDALAAQARRAASARAQAEALLQRLGGFRGDYLRQSPARAGQAMAVGRLQAFQQFIARLDQAIAMQQQELQARAREQEESQRLLGEAQRRLMAFELLARRRASERERAAQRQAQRDTDEFAARALRPRPQE